MILIPMLVLVTYSLSGYSGQTLYWFPRHLLTTLFCTITLFIYPLILKNKKSRIIGLVVSSILFVMTIIIVIINPHVYNTTIAFSDSNMIGYFDTTYNVYLKEKKYGDIKITYDDNLEAYRMDAKFKHGGKTKLIIESLDNKKKCFDLNIKYSYYDIKESKCLF